MPQKLGQNFLKSGKVASRIADSADITKKDVVLEIGPGKGILTEKLLEQAGKVIAVEKDMELAEFLQVKFSEQIKRTGPKLEIVRDDILKFNPKNHKLKPKNYKIVANIPYYITSRIIRVFLESDIQPSSITIMLQKEVAERIVAKPPRMSLLAISVQAFGDPRLLFYVSKNKFIPEPKVDSAVIQIANISRDFFTKNKITEKKFFHLIKTGFAQKRKMLINNLKKVAKEQKLHEELAEIFQQCQIPPKSRAENLTLNDWARLYKKLYN